MASVTRCPYTRVVRLSDDKGALSIEVYQEGNRKKVMETDRNPFLRSARKRTHMGKTNVEFQPVAGSLMTLKVLEHVQLVTQF